MPRCAASGTNLTADTEACNLFRTAKSHEELAPDRIVPVAEGIAYRVGAGSPGTSAQHLEVGAEEDLGILAVGEAFEALVRCEVARGPLPDVPDHAQDAAGTRPCRVRADLQPARRRAGPGLLSGVGGLSPHGKSLLVPVSGSQEAAFSHSASVGRRLPTHLAYASAS
jgi:hypothetical protein